MTLLNMTFDDNLKQAKKMSIFIVSILSYCQVLKNIFVSLFVFIQLILYSIQKKINTYIIIAFKINISLMGTFVLYWVINSCALVK